MSLITSIANYLSNLRTYTLTQVTNIVDARWRGDTAATKANKEYHYNNIAGYLKALGWAAYWKNTLYVKLDAPNDFDGSDSMIFQTAQEAVDAIPSTGASKPTAINPYVIIGDPLVDFSAVDWSTHITAGTYPFILTTTIGGTGSADSNTTVKAPVRVATTAALPACTYSNTTMTLTGNADGALSAIDGVTPVLGDDILVINQVTGLQNGIYTVTQLGDVDDPFILTRRDDSNSSEKLVSGILIPVAEGTYYSNSIFILTTNNPITIGVTTLLFSQYPVKIKIINTDAEISIGNAIDISNRQGAGNPNVTHNYAENIQGVLIADNTAAVMLGAILRLANARNDTLGIPGQYGQADFVRFINEELNRNVFCIDKNGNIHTGRDNAYGQGIIEITALAGDTNTYYLYLVASNESTVIFSVTKSNGDVTTLGKYTGKALKPNGVLINADAATAQSGRVTGYNKYTVADDGAINLFGTGLASPGTDFAGKLKIYATAADLSPASTSVENFGEFFIQLGSGANSAASKTLSAGANVEIVAVNGAAPQLSDITDGKLGIVISGGSGTVRCIRVYNRLGATSYVHIQFETFIDAQA